MSIENDRQDYIEKWGQDLLEDPTWQERLEDDYKSMHRTSLITICGVREAAVMKTIAHAENALYGNKTPEFEGLTDNETQGTIDFLKFVYELED